ncbi:TerD family protein [Actinomadura roseirufa]|uniref:TerD family protein n=1 Tax=Actinomadura roseirufa TaxID=2094049 RepID=UPI001A9552C2|nr:TerD family protein [Actinomadura roseirufa]
MGPFYASTSLSGGRRRTTTTRRAPARRSTVPSAAQLERARRQAERAQQEAQRAAAIAELQELRRQSTSVHLQDFPTAAPPAVPTPPNLGPAWARAEALAFHLQGVGRLARNARSAAKQAAEQDAATYLATEQARLRQVHHHLAAEAAHWWQALVGNDEEVVCEAVNTAVADNPAAGCAVGVDGAVLSVVMRQQDLDTLPDQSPGLTPSGRPTLKKLTQRDRMLWWLTIMGSNLIATVKEALATAPGIAAIDLAVLTRIPDTRRLGIVAYGRWTRQAIESVRWSDPQDALRFLDIGQDVTCSITTTASGNISSKIKPVDVDRLPGLRALLDNAQDESEPGAPSLARLDADLAANPVPSRPLADPYQITPFAEWKRQAAPAPWPERKPAPPAPAPQPSATRVAGQTVVLPEIAQQGLVVSFTFAGSDADLTLLLTGADGLVAVDEDFIFYNQPTAANGAVRLLGKQPEGPRLVERAALHLAALPPRVERVVVSINMDVDTGLTCGALTQAVLDARCVTGAAWHFSVPADPNIRAMVVAEFYRHIVDGAPAWKLRAVGQGWSDGLDGLARAHGVHVD